MAAQIENLYLSNTNRTRLATNVFQRVENSLKHGMNSGLVISTLDNNMKNLLSRVDRKKITSKNVHDVLAQLNRIAVENTAQLINRTTITNPIDTQLRRDSDMGKRTPSLPPQHPAVLMRPRDALNVPNPVGDLSSVFDQKLTELPQETSFESFDQRLQRIHSERAAQFLPPAQDMVPQQQQQQQQMMVPQQQQQQMMVPQQQQQQMMVPQQEQLVSQQQQMMVPQQQQMMPQQQQIMVPQQQQMIVPQEQQMIVPQEQQLIVPQEQQMVVSQQTASQGTASEQQTRINVLRQMADVVQEKARLQEEIYHLKDLESTLNQQIKALKETRSRFATNFPRHILIDTSGPSAGSSDYIFKLSTSCTDVVKMVVTKLSVPMIEYNVYSPFDYTKEDGSVAKVEVKPGNYTLQRLIESLNSEAPDLKVHYDQDTNRVHIAEGVSIHPGQISRILGIQTNTPPDLRPTAYVSLHIPNLFGDDVVCQVSDGSLTVPATMTFRTPTLVEEVNIVLRDQWGNEAYCDGLPHVIEFWLYK